jgi:hypothetical protein
VGRNERCPCGSGDKFKRCHWDVIQEISRRVRPATLREQFRKWVQCGADVSRLQYPAV